MSRKRVDPPSLDRLRELLNYDPETGNFFWKEHRGLAGTVAGSINRAGYRRIKLDRQEYFAHRLAWLYVYEQWPARDLDHIDGGRAHNAIGNLREATPTENAQNLASARKHTVSGFLGVTWNKNLKKWQASIRSNGHLQHLGLRETPEEAHQLYLEAKVGLHQFNPMPRLV